MSSKLVRVFLALILAAIGAAPSLAATLLPPGEIQMIDANGSPLAGGSVFFYVPSTTTTKTTWQDSGQSVLNTNPVVLDAAGRAIVYGSGTYRMVVYSCPPTSPGCGAGTGTLQYDALTADTSATGSVQWGGTGGGTANSQTVTVSGFSQTDGQIIAFVAGASNTAAMTLTVSGGSAIAVLKDTTSGPVTTSGGEVVSGNVTMLVYVTATASFHLVNPAPTLSAGAATNVASASTTDLGSVFGHVAVVTGTTTITSFGSSATTTYPFYFVRFAGAMLLTQNASSLILPGAASITTTSGDFAIAEYLGSGNWRIDSYSYVNPPFVPPPQGRLTLTSGSPVMTADVTSSASVFYTPYVGNQVAISAGGTGFVPYTFAEQTLSLVASHAANSNYDVFESLNAGVLTLCTGPAWTSDTARGTGAGTTELERKLGLQLNKNSMNCRNGATTFTVAADSGTYLGTIRTSGSTGDTVWIANPAAAAGGGNARLYVWNEYNRVPIAALSKDSTDTWSSATITAHVANIGGTGSGLNNRVSAVFGFNEDAMAAQYNAVISSTAGGANSAGVGLDSTTAFSGSPGNANNNASLAGAYYGIPGTGLHFFQALEASDPGGTTWIGDNGAPLLRQMAISLQGRM